MAATYTPSSSTFNSTITVPEKGDKNTAVSITTALKRVADNAAFVNAAATAGAATADAIKAAPIVTTTATSALSNETNLGALTTGLVKMSVSAGVATLSTAVAGTDYVTSSSASSTPRVIRSALTLGSSYEVRSSPGLPTGRRFLGLKRYTDFSLYNRTIGAADSENGWTWVNRAGNLGTCNENNTTANHARVAVAAVTTAWNGATRTAPFCYRTAIIPANITTVITARIKVGTTTANGQLAGLLICQDSATNVFAAQWYGYTGATNKGEAFAGGAGTSITANAATQAAGVWAQMVIRNGRSVDVYYSTANQSTPPSDWTFVVSYEDLFPAGALLRFGRVYLGSASGAYNTDWAYYDDSLPIDTRTYSSTYMGKSWAAQGYVTTSPAIQLITDWDMGTAGSISQAQLRQILADAENLLDPGTTSSWTYSAVMSGSAGAAAGTYYAAGALVLSGSGRYCNLFAKATSDGFFPASLDIDSIYMPITP